MPLLLALGLLLPSGFLLLNSKDDEPSPITQAATTGGVNLVLLGAAALGLYAAFRVISKGAR